MDGLEIDVEVTFMADHSTDSPSICPSAHLPGSVGVQYILARSDLGVGWVKDKCGPKYV